MYYNDKFDADQQVDLEERIAALIYDEAETGPFGNEEVDEQSANDLSKKILQMVVAELRPDLVAHKWRISEGNATEIYEDWIELCGVAEEWYSYIEENEWPEHLVFPKMYFGDIPEGDIETLNRFIRAWEEKIAHAAGFKDFAGHGNYAVSAASEMGLNLTVEEVEE